MQGPGATRTRQLASGTTLALVAAAVIEFLLETWRVRAHIDDAYISYRYARNLADGLGLVYNAGEYVEGFTNPLWTLLVASGVALGGDAEVLGHVLGAAAGVAVLVGTAAYAWVLLEEPKRWIAGLAPWVVLAHPALVRWSESGMESSLFAACLVLALFFQAGGRAVGVTGSLVLATLTRPEGALFAAILFGLTLRERGLRCRRAWLGPLAYTVFLAALTACRLAYYGSPLPNTFYAKVSMAAPYAFGARNVGSFLAGGIFLMLPPLIVAVVGDRRCWAGGATVAAGLLYVVAIGGDTIGPTRFFLPLLPPLAVLALSGVQRAWERRRVVGLAMAALICATVVWQVGWMRAETIERVRRTRVKLRTVAARQVALLSGEQPPPLVASAGIGYFGYASRLPVLDLLGLVDATIARTPLPETGPTPELPGHQRSNAEYVLSRRPDYILTGSRKGHPLLRAHRELLEHPEFARRYEWDAVVKGYRRTR